MDNPSAFPVNTTNASNPGAYEADPGMTLRDWFAGQALAGIVAAAFGSKADNFEETVAYGAYAIADAMLLSRQENPNG